MNLIQREKKKKKKKQTTTHKYYTHAFVCVENLYANAMDIIFNLIIYLFDIHKFSVDLWWPIGWLATSTQL